jgi:glyoxylase-like metal-dependent hydrolase (beta-lactamase superfamily II)
MADLEVYAAIVGRAQRQRCLMFHLSSRHDEVELVYPFWILRERSSVTLIDTGFPAPVAQARGISDHGDPTALLGELGIAPGDVSRVVLSHLHYDHFCAPERYPNARFVVQRDDVAFFCGPGRTQPAGALADPPSIAALDELRRAGRLVELDGDKNLDGGLGVVRIGGHTPGSQLIVLERGDGPVVFACDCSHFYENARTKTPSTLIYRYDEYQRGFASIERLAAGGRWFPGHDPTMLERLDPVHARIYALRDA